MKTEMINNAEMSKMIKSSNSTMINENDIYSQVQFNGYDVYDKDQSGDIHQWITTHKWVTPNKEATQNWRY